MQTLLDLLTGRIQSEGPPLSRKRSRGRPKGPEEVTHVVYAVRSRNGEEEDMESFKILQDEAWAQAVERLVEVGVEQISWTRGSFEMAWRSLFQYLDLKCWQGILATPIPSEYDWVPIRRFLLAHQNPFQAPPNPPMDTSAKDNLARILSRPSDDFTTRANLQVEGDTFFSDLYTRERWRAAVNTYTRCLEATSQRSESKEECPMCQEPAEYKLCETHLACKTCSMIQRATKEECPVCRGPLLEPMQLHPPEQPFQQDYLGPGFEGVATLCVVWRQSGPIPTLTIEVKFEGVCLSPLGLEPILQDTGSLRALVSPRSGTVAETVFAFVDLETSKRFANLVSNLWSLGLLTYFDNVGDIVVRGPLRSVLDFGNHQESELLLGDLPTSMVALESLVDKLLDPST